MSNKNDISATFDPKTYDSTFIADLVAFVGADDFQTLFEAFFIKYAVEFSDEPEHQLHYTAIYEKFQALFESQLELFCKTKNLTQPDFVKKCREVSTKDTQTQKYIEILLSSVEYETFVRLMLFMKPIAVERRKNGENITIDATSAEPKSRTTPNKDSTSSKAIPSTSPSATTNATSPNSATAAGSKGISATSPSSGSKGVPVHNSESKDNPMANRGGFAKGGSK